MNRTLRALLASLAAMAAIPVAQAAPAAQAVPAAPTPTSHRATSSGSLVFIKSFDVWLSRGDGSHAHRITRDGTRTQPYRSPSEADNGTIVAARGSRIVRMTQSGRVLNRIDPPRLLNSAGQPMDGVVNEVAISPDAKRIAYSYVRYTCVDGADCFPRYVTGYTLATRNRKAGVPTYFHDVSWVSNSRTLQSGGYGSQVMVHDISRAPVHWFDDSDYAGIGVDTDLADGDLSPDGRWFTAIRGYGATSAIAWFRVGGNARTGPPPAYPEIVCLTGGEAQHAAPTWSPDSTALAWAARDGIWIQRGAVAGDCGAGRLVIRGGSAPQWSPARVR